MRPYRIDIPDSELADLRSRIALTRWPTAVSVPGWERGVPVDYLRELAEYWQSTYDWRAAEQELNQYPQYVTEIDGVDIHFLHVRSAEPNARPLLLTHGWPGSIVEFLDVIGPLTDPRAHGLDPALAFHLVIPSIPGHGFSGPVTEPGWGVERVATAWAELMRRLDYGSYVTAGGDWGSIISLELSRRAPEQVQGAYLSMLLTVPSGDPAEMETLDEADFGRLAELGRFDAELSGYMKVQTTRPLTVGYGLTDSPVGQLAWIVEKFHDWNKAVKTPDEEVGRDRLLTNVTLYWLTGTASSSAQFYYESGAHLGAIFTPGVAPEPVAVPIGVGVFGQDPGLPIRKFAERDYSTITHGSEFDQGGHFAALERPELYVGDLRAFVASLDDR
jgi:pimeloyl-ACP methyl ester carboxylesterase